MSSESFTAQLNRLTTTNLSALDDTTVGDVKVSVDTLAGGIRQTLTMAHREHGSDYSPSPIPVRKAFQAALRALTKYAPTWAPEFRSLSHADISAFSIGGGFNRQIEDSWGDHKAFIADFLGTCLERLQDRLLSSSNSSQNDEPLKEISLDPFDDGMIQQQKAKASVK